MERYRGSLKTRFPTCPQRLSRVSIPQSTEVTAGIGTSFRGADVPWLESSVGVSLEKHTVLSASVNSSRRAPGLGGAISLSLTPASKVNDD